MAGQSTTAVGESTTAVGQSTTAVEQSTIAANPCRRRACLAHLSLVSMRYRSGHGEKLTMCLLGRRRIFRLGGWERRKVDDHRREGRLSWIIGTPMRTSGLRTMTNWRHVGLRRRGLRNVLGRIRSWVRRLLWLRRQLVWRRERQSGCRSERNGGQTRGEDGDPHGCKRKCVW